MHINVSQAFAHQTIIFNKLHHFFMLPRDGLGKRLEISEDFISVMEIAARQFADDEGNGVDAPPKPMCQPRPFWLSSPRRRGIISKSLSVPPRGRPYHGDGGPLDLHDNQGLRNRQGPGSRPVLPKWPGLRPVFLREATRSGVALGPLGRQPIKNL
jgi:hypothetical protein